jgi:selenocysteine lyase/cysteine desulfurase
MNRRSFLAALAVTAPGVLAGCRRDDKAPRVAAADAASGPLGWDEVRRAFALSRDHLHLSALLVAAHPRPVREAIERHRRALDEDPVLYLEANNGRLRGETRAAAAAYLGASLDEVALTDSTTMGLGLVYHGLRLRRGDEILTTEHDYYATHEAVRLAAARAGARVRRVALYDRLDAVSADEIVSRVSRAIRPRTRLLALTWVHSGTGLKLPLAGIADVVAAVNRRRGRESERVLLAADAVHGFGIEDAGVEDLGVDYFIAGCHKWLFGPRGTGIVWARPAAWRQLRPVIPSFIDHGAWQAWMEGETPDGPTTAARMTPGGFKPFEHQWALAEAFGFHAAVGKARVAERTHALATQLKEGLAEMAHVTLRTPRGAGLSAGIVCFEVAGLTPWQVVERLRERRVIATVTPYAARYARLTPSILNTPEEIDEALRAVRTLA